MPDLIYREKFFNRDEKPAWHQLGVNKRVDLTAAQAIEEFGGAPRVYLQDIQTSDGIGLPYKAIMRDPDPRDPKDSHVCFNVVSDEYGIITHEQMIYIWDRVVKRPVETLGFLRDGSVLFITAELPTFSVRGEEVKNYFLAHSPITGVDVASVSRSSVRTVCSNTLAQALRGANVIYKITHDQNAAVNMAKWLKGLYEQFEEHNATVKQVFEILAKRRVNDNEELMVLDRAYPIPTEPNRDAPDEVVEARMKDHESHVKRLEVYRAEAHKLFHGEMRGYKSDLAGSAWYLYNAVGELENYRRGRGEAQVAASVTFGERADTMKRTFAACLDLCRN